MVQQPHIRYIYHSIMAAIDKGSITGAFDDDLNVTIKEKMKSLEIKIGTRTFAVIVMEVK